MASTRKPDFWEGFEAIKDRNWTIQKKWPMLWDLGVIDLAFSFPWGPRSWTKTLWSQKNPSKGTQTKKNTNSTEVVSGHKTDSWWGPWCVFAKSLRNLNRHALANAWLVECRNDGLRKTRLKKKKQPTKNEWSAKIPTKTDSTGSVVSSTCGSKGIFLLFETSTVQDWNDRFFKPFFVGDFVNGWTSRRKAFGSYLCDEPSLVAPQAEKPPSRSCSRESRRWDGRGETWLKVKCVKEKRLGTDVKWRGKTGNKLTKQTENSHSDQCLSFQLLRMTKTKI